MKKLLILFFISSFAKAQTTTPDSAKYFEGSLKTVCGTIATVSLSKKGTFSINFGKPYPNNEFSAVVMPDDSAGIDLELIKSHKDKEVCVTGKIKMYKGKPEIIIKVKDQIRYPDKKK